MPTSIGDKGLAAASLATLAIIVSSCRKVEIEREPPHVIPFHAPPLSDPSASPTPDSVIEGLIQSLSEISTPDFGLAGTLWGSAFPPVVGSEHAGVWLHTDHQLERSPSLTRLVVLGQEAVPLLLKHIDDPSPTQLKIVHKGFGGIMTYRCELPANDACAAEKADLESSGIEPDEHRGRADLNRGHTPTHTISVGDVCFTILGMITNRPYSAVRYQPSGCIVINSPRKDPRLALAVRKMWSGPDARAALYQRLLADLHSRGGLDPGQEAGAGDTSFLEKLRRMLLSSNGGYSYPSIEPQGLLHAIGELHSDRAAEIFTEYLRAGGRESAVNLVDCLSKSHTELAPRVLIPVLGERSAGLGYYPDTEVEPTSGAQKPDSVPFRLCDNAYFLISAALGEKNLKPGRTPQEMDVRISELRKRLASN